MAKMYEVKIKRDAVINDFYIDEAGNECLQHLFQPVEDAILLQTENLEEAKCFFEKSKGMKIPFDEIDDSDVINLNLISIVKNGDNLDLEVLDSKILKDYVEEEYLY